MASVGTPREVEGAESQNKLEDDNLARFAVEHPDTNQRWKMPMCGGSRKVQNTLEHDDLARFAVDHHNTNQKGVLQFHKVVNVVESLVAGMLYLITLEAADGAHKKVYKTRVWVKPWMDFKQVQDFKHVGDA